MSPYQDHGRGRRSTGTIFWCDLHLPSAAAGPIDWDTHGMYVAILYAERSHAGSGNPCQYGYRVLVMLSPSLLSLFSPNVL